MDIHVTYYFGDGIPVSELAPKELPPVRQLGWVRLAGNMYERFGNWDEAIHAADLCYFLNVRPGSVEHGDMIKRFREWILKS